MTKCSQPSTIKVGKVLEMVFQSTSKPKNRNLDENFLYDMNNQTPKKQCSGNFAFLFPTMFESEIYFGEKRFNEVVSQASCRIILIGDFFGEMEMYDTVNKPSLCFISVKFRNSAV